MISEIKKHIGCGLTQFITPLNVNILANDGKRYALDDAAILFKNWLYNDCDEGGLTISVGPKIKEFTNEQKRLAFFLALAKLKPNDVIDYNCRGLTTEEKNGVEKIYREIEKAVLELP